MSEIETKASPEATLEPEIETDELPKTIIRRMVKDKLSQLSSASDLSVQRHSLTAFSESSRIFIQYLSATANDICRDAKRTTVNAEDVFKALEEMEFMEFVAPLRSSLTEFRKITAGKKSGSAKVKEPEDKGKKRVSPARNGRVSENGDEDEDSSSD